jgi:lysophospholipase L1-like esterase
MKTLLLCSLLLFATPKEFILFVGDSYSVGTTVSYNYTISKKHENWKSKHVVKSGVTTSWMLRELEVDLTYNTYNRIFIFGGVNDLYGGGNVDKTVDNVINMVKLAKEQKAKVYVILGFSPRFYKRCLDPYFPKRYGEYQKKLQLRVKDAIIIPIFDIGDQYAARDGVHPTAKGYKLFEKHVEFYLQENKDN